MFCDNLEIWVSLICDEFHVILSSEELHIALITENSTDLIELSLANWDYGKCRIWYKTSLLSKRIPVVQEAIYLEISAIPYGTERCFLEEKIKFKGERWVLHKNDADPFPSSPHAHNYEAMLTLHLGNGDLYNGTRKVGKVKKKDFIKIRNSFKSIAMPRLDISL